MTTQFNGKDADEFQQDDLARNENEICSKIRLLADEVGLSYEETTLPEEIILALSDELEAQIDNSEDNPTALSELMGLYHKLDALDEALDYIHSFNCDFVSGDTISVRVTE